MYDLLIIGSGPAGISAALSAKARDLDFVWFGMKNLSAKIEKAEKISNYPGLSSITGQEMKNVFLRQIEQAGITLQTLRIDSVYNMGGYYTACANDQMFDGRTIILAAGMAGAKEIPGESRLLGKGVSYCATCDGNLYRGKEIAIVCTAPELEEEIEYLAGLAKKATVYTCYHGFHSTSDNVIHKFGYPSQISGEKRVENLTCGGETLPADGVFILRHSVSPAALLRGLAMEGGHIVVDRQQKTNLPGCFAAGDCTGRPYQYTKAVGEGNVALHSAIDYLNEKKKEGAGR